VLAAIAAPDLEVDGAAKGADADLVAVGLEHEPERKKGDGLTGFPCWVSR
jgi:hypothetical protein